MFIKGRAEVHFQPKSHVSLDDFERIPKIKIFTVLLLAIAIVVLPEVATPY